MKIKIVQSPSVSASYLRWVMGSLLLFLPSLLYSQQAGPSPTIIVSPDTTHITAPLRSDGLPDYEQYARQVYGEGVSPDRNAAVLLWQAMWPGELEPEDYEPFCRERGLAEVPSADASCEPLDGEANQQRILEWLQKSGHSNPTQANVVKLLENTSDRSWTIKSVPPLAAWVQKNRRALDLIVAAAQRPQFYSPSPSLLNDVDESLVEMLVPGTQMARAAAKSISTRAMSYLGEGHVGRAWRDILATHRLARILPKESLIDYLVALRIEQNACDATLALLSHPQISVDQAKLIQRDILALTEFGDLADCYDSIERAFYLDSIMALRSGRAAGWEELKGLGEEPFKSALDSVDWNIALREGNEIYDQIAAASRLPNGPTRNRAISSINERIERASTDVTRLAFIFRLNEQERSQVFSSVAIALLVPTYDAALEAQDRGNTRRRMMRLGAALTVCRASRGAFPERLEDMVPDIIEELPVDAYNAKPFRYKGDGDGYLLYSLSKNGADDGGSNSQLGVLDGREIDDMSEETKSELESKIPAGADDIPIRVPRPRFELPKLQAIPQ